jgi:hypothetical protein
MLALNGEVGELQEIFQWKGDFKGAFNTNEVEKLKEMFTEKEFINIGEEISDVFIYTTNRKSFFLLARCNSMVC